MQNHFIQALLLAFIASFIASACEGERTLNLLKQAANNEDIKVLKSELARIVKVVDNENPIETERLRKRLEYLLSELKLIQARGKRGLSLLEVKAKGFLLFADDEIAYIKKKLRSIDTAKSRMKKIKEEIQKLRDANERLKKRLKLL